MSYWQHLKANWKVAGRCLVLAFFHFVHGLIPRENTSHHRWGVD